MVADHLHAFSTKKKTSLHRPPWPFLLKLILKSCYCRVAFQAKTVRAAEDGLEMTNEEDRLRELRNSREKSSPHNKIRPDHPCVHRAETTGNLERSGGGRVVMFADGEAGDSNKDDVSGSRLSYWPECNVPRSDAEARSDFGGIAPNEMSVVLKNRVVYLRTWSADGVSSKDQAPEERTSWHFLCQGNVCGFCDGDYEQHEGLGWTSDHHPWQRVCPNPKCKGLICGNVACRCYGCWRTNYNVL